MGFFEKLKNGLFKTKNAIVGKIDNLFKSFRKVDEDLFEELEELLISADIGVNTTEEILDELRDNVKENKIKEPEDVKNELLRMLRELIGEHEPLKLDTKPSVILVIGVNGVGKTTSIGKISAELKSQGKKVVVAAADTFRAAAAEQPAVHSLCRNFITGQHLGPVLSVENLFHRLVYIHCFKGCFFAVFIQPVKVQIIAVL